ncbi:hypothetical protein [Deinococcus sonorensis]|uniref:DUF4352 domain-containing protein n=2 Tax=Deinococcus sonorensis TaxID=309891 RepID=A0AAU7U5K0_9DEIO
MMRHPLFVSALTLALISAAHAATTPAVQTGRPVVQGTQQLDGQNAQVGQTFTIGKQSPLNFTLRSAEYSTGRMLFGDTITFPKADEKLLILHYTVQNPQKREARYYWGDIKFTAVDALDRNHDYVQAVAREGTTDKFEITLKPAQKVDVVTVIVVPAAGPVPKLMVQREENGTPQVLRYDLRAKAKPLNAPFADPEDRSGATAALRVNVPAGKVVPLRYFDVRLDRVTFTAEPLLGRAPAPGRRYLTATFVIKNPLGRDVEYSWGNFQASLKDADGERVEYNQLMLKASRDEKASGTLPRGEEARVRFYWELPETVAGDTVYLTDESGRAYAFDVKATK